MITLIYLNFNEVKFSERFKERLYGMQGCGVSMNMVLKGVLKNDSKSGYGHLGTNNAELVILKIIDFGKLKYNKD